MIRWQKSIDLGGHDWQLGRAQAAPLWQGNNLSEVEEWLPATVPGNVEADLLASGRIGDPSVGLQNEGGRWVEACDWWYRRTISMPLEPAHRAHLIFHGVDYYSSLYINGVRLGDHEGMFSRQIYDLTDIVRCSGGEIALAMRLWGAHALPAQKLKLWQHLADVLLRGLSVSQDRFPSRVQTLKCQMSFGWDFAPPLPTAGIWDDVELVLSGPVFIADIWVQTQPEDSRAQVRVCLSLHSIVSGSGRLTAIVRGANFADEAQFFVFDINLTEGPQAVSVAFALSSIQLWQPWDRGEPHLYTLTVEIQPSATATPTTASTTFGIRSLTMQVQPGCHEAWSFVINGQREFIRGVNWVPADILPGRVREQDYATLLGLAKAANANMVRVWGGGLREKQAFYDLCDRLGLLVWQEFPLACPYLARYRRDRSFLELVRHEATSIVRTLRNHPALVLWCGGNEFSVSRNKPVVDCLARAVQENDGTRPFRPASPSAEDHHNWLVWHHYAPLREYLNEQAPFVSEFGLQAAPSRASLERFIPAADLWPPGLAWQYHNAEMKKLKHYAHCGDHTTLQDFITATQTVQARGVQIMVEHMRRRQHESGGVIVWQLNEPWPSICWSLITYDRQPKLAYYTLRRAFNPLLVSVEYPLRRYRSGDSLELTLWIINDRAAAWPGQEPGSSGAEAALLTLTIDDQIIYRRYVDLENNSSQTVGQVMVQLPQHAAPWLLRAELWYENCLLSDNEYDLSYYDDRHMPPAHIVLAWLGKWLLR